MTDYATRFLNPLELLAAAETVDTGTGAVPDTYVDQLTWTYIGGMDFISELRQLAGSWKLVDYAFESRPPATTEQVIHPEKYVRDERPSKVTIDSAPLRDRGWKPVDRNTLGELATTQLLELGGDATGAEAAAAGWNGDRYELWRRDVGPGDCESPCRADLVLVAKWKWDTASDRREFAGWLAEYVATGLDGELIADDEPVADVWRVEGGVVARASAGREATLVFAPNVATAEAVASR